MTTSVVTRTAEERVAWTGALAAWRTPARTLARVRLPADTAEAVEVRTDAVVSTATVRRVMTPARSRRT